MLIKPNWLIALRWVGIQAPIPLACMCWHAAALARTQGTLPKADGELGAARVEAAQFQLKSFCSRCVPLLAALEQTYKANTQPMLSHINVGTGVDCTIRELAQTMQRVVGFEGKLVFDTTKPDGTPRKLMNVDRLKSLGWQYSIDLETGLNKTYAWFLSNVEGLRQV